jgi:hypothetical protein
MSMRLIAATALLGTLLLTSSTATLAASGATGTVEVTVTDPAKQPIPQWVICPTTKPHGTKKAGGCATTNAAGHAKLTRVKPGVVYVSWFVGGNPEVSDPKKITVSPHHTVHVRWEDAGS